MVTIKSFERKVNSESDEEFFSLTLETSNVDIVRSKSGRIYATKRSCSIGSTLDEASCQALIGTSLEGKIHRVQCEPYEVVDKTTGEVRMSDHRYEYFKEDEIPPERVDDQKLVATEELVSA